MVVMHFKNIWKFSGSYADYTWIDPATMCKLGQREDSQSVLQCLPRTSWPQDLIFPALCFRLDKEETIATFSIGFADGYSRQLSGKGVVTTMDGETTGFSLSGYSFSSFLLSRRPKFTVLCCQLRAFKSPQVHSVMFPTPCFQVAPSSQCYVSNSVLSSRPKFTVLCCQLRTFKSPHFHRVMLSTPCFQVAPCSQCSVLSSRPSLQLCCQLRAFKSPQVHRVMLPNPYFQVATSSKCYVANSVLSSRPKFTVSCCQLQVKNGRLWVECRWTPSPSRSGRAQPSARLSTSTRTTWPRPTAWRAWREPWTPTLPMWQPR